MFGIGKKKEETQATSCCCNQPDKGNAQCGCNMADQADCGCAANVGNTVKILGSGCKNCHTLLENTQAAVKAMDKSDSFISEFNMCRDAQAEDYNIDKEFLKDHLNVEQR